MNRFSRAITVLALNASLLAGSLTTLAQTSQSGNSQTQNQTTAKAAQAQPAAQPAAAPAKTGKPLSTNDDPAMIGKRNINGGIISKMSGSTEKEVRLGRELAAEVDRQAKFIEDPLITEYVNRVGQNIVLHSDAKVPFTIKVIDSDEVNAFALPGGFFYVNKGLLLAADNEAELAGVMAHEIAHVAARQQTLLDERIAESDRHYSLVEAIVIAGTVAAIVIATLASVATTYALERCSTRKREVSCS